MRCLCVIMWEPNRLHTEGLQQEAIKTAVHLLGDTAHLSKVHLPWSVSAMPLAARRVRSWFSTENYQSQAKLTRLYVWGRILIFQICNDFFSYTTQVFFKAECDHFKDQLLPERTHGKRTKLGLASVPWSQPPKLPPLPAMSPASLLPWAAEPAWRSE